MISLETLNAHMKMQYTETCRPRAVICNGVKYLWSDFFRQYVSDDEQRHAAKIFEAAFEVKGE